MNTFVIIGTVASVEQYSIYLVCSCVILLLKVLWEAVGVHKIKILGLIHIAIYYWYCSYLLPLSVMHSSIVVIFSEPHVT